MDFSSLGPTNVFEGIDRVRTHVVMKKAFSRLGYEIFREGTTLYVSRQGKGCFLFESETSFTSVAGARAFKNKKLTNRILTRFGVNVAEQYAFSLEQLDQARPAVARLGEVVVKPVDGRKSKGVSLGVTVDTLDSAWHLACGETRKGIIVESYFRAGYEARYLVVDGACVAVVERIPPFVCGDGIRTIEKLIEDKNALRASNPMLNRALINLDEERLEFLKERELEPGSVLPERVCLQLSPFPLVGRGGETRNITELVHPKMKAIAERVTKTAPNLDVIGVDIRAIDHANPPTSDNYVVIEVNTRPGLGVHLYPAHGEAIDVARIIAEACDRKLFPGEPRRATTSEASSHGGGTPAP